MSKSDTQWFLGPRRLSFFVGFYFEFLGKVLMPQKPLVYKIVIVLSIAVLQAVLDKSPVSCATAQHVEHRSRLQNVTCSSTAVLPMSAVRVLIELGYLRSDGIQMYVAN